MIQLLFALLTGEVAVVLLLIIKNPFRKLVLLGIDRIKRGRGPFMVRTVAATIFVLLSSSLHSMFKIQNRSSTEMGTLTPTDQVLWSRHFLESSLMGYSLLLVLIIDRTHHFIKEIRRLKKSVDAAVSQSRAATGGRKDDSE